MDWLSIKDILITAGLGEMAKIAVGELLKVLSMDYEPSVYDRTSQVLKEYLIYSYKNTAIMHTIVFRGVEKNIFDLYIPLTLNYTVEEEKGSIVVDEKCIPEILSRKASIIVDSAGMGKTTIVKFLATQIVLDKAGIPIIVELRKLNKGKTILSFIEEQFDLFDKKIEKDDLKKLLKAGGFIIFFDGYDEIPEEQRQTITEDIRHFIDVTPENTYILTSREESELSSFGNFFEYSIKPLEIDEAFSLIKKYDNDGEKSKKLIETIKEEKNLNVLKEFLTNPLLVSLLYKTYVYKEEIPYKKIEFYKQVYEALYNDHDKSKGAYVHPKKSKLDINDFERVLMSLGFLGIKKWRVEYEKEGLIKDINVSIKNLVGHNPTSYDFFDDISHAVPIFQRDGNMYRWVHKSFMEYFAAKYICYEIGDAKETLLSNIGFKGDNIKYLNVLDFCYELDLKTFRRSILLKWLKGLLKAQNEVKNFLEDNAIKYKSDKALTMQLLHLWFYGKIYVMQANDEQKRNMDSNDSQNMTETFNQFVEALKVINNECVSEMEMFYSFSGFFVARERKIGEAVEKIVWMKKLPILNEDAIKMISYEEQEIDWLTEGKIYSLEELVVEIYNKDYLPEKIINFFGKIGVRPRFGFNVEKCEELLREIEKEIAVIQDLNNSFFDISL